MTQDVRELARQVEAALITMDRLTVPEECWAKAEAVLSDALRAAAASARREAIEECKGEVGVKADPDDEFDRGYNYAMRTMLLRMSALAAQGGDDGE